jgi:hypothetical protein
MSWSDDFGSDSGGGDYESYGGGLSYKDEDRMVQTFGGEFGGDRGFQIEGPGVDKDESEEDILANVYREKLDILADIQVFQKYAKKGFQEFCLETEQALVLYTQKTYTNRSRLGRGFTTHSGDLKNSIFGGVIVGDDKITITLGAGGSGVEYAEYVEQVSGGTFAYLMPALQDYKPKIEKGLVDYMDRINKAIELRNKTKKRKA